MQKNPTYKYLFGTLPLINVFYLVTTVTLIHHVIKCKIKCFKKILLLVLKIFSIVLRWNLKSLGHLAYKKI